MSGQFSPDQIDTFLTLAARNMERLVECTAGVDTARLTQPLQVGEWSMVEILAHLRGCIEIWSSEIYTMLKLNRPKLPQIHPRQWAKKQGYAARTFDENLRVLLDAHEDLLAVLRSLSPEDWRKSMTIKGREHSVFSHVRRLVLHESGHCDQIEAALKSK